MNSIQKARVNRKVLFNIEEPSSSSENQTVDNDPSPVESVKEQPNKTNSQKSKKPDRIELPVPQLSVGTADQTPTGETCLDDISHLNILVAEDNSVNQIDQEDVET